MKIPDEVKTTIKDVLNYLTHKDAQIQSALMATD